MTLYDLLARLRQDRSLVAAELAGLDRAIEQFEQRLAGTQMTDQQIAALQIGDTVHRLWEGRCCLTYHVTGVGKADGRAEAYIAYRGPGAAHVARITADRDDVHLPGECPAEELAQQFAPIVSLNAARRRRRLEGGD